MNFFLINITYQRQTGEDNPGKVKETYVVESINPSNAEARLLEEIGKAPERRWPLQEMAAFCHCSTAQLRRNMLEYTGMLPKECIENIRFQYAAEMLTSQELSIEEIGQRLGYPDRFHFSRRFKAFFGVAPGQFRDEFPKRHA